MNDYLDITGGSPSSPPDSWWWHHAGQGAEPMLPDIESYAAHLGQDPLWCLHLAWCVACGEITDSDSGDRRSRLSKSQKLTELAGKIRRSLLRIMA